MPVSLRTLSLEDRFTEGSLRMMSCWMSSLLLCARSHHQNQFTKNDAKPKGSWDPPSCILVDCALGTSSALTTLLGRDELAVGTTASLASPSDRDGSSLEAAHTSLVDVAVLGQRSLAVCKLGRLGVVGLVLQVCGLRTREYTR